MTSYLTCSQSSLHSVSHSIGLVWYKLPLIRPEHELVPANDGGNLYIRPTLLETSEGYGIKEDAFAAEALLYIVTTQNLGMGLYPSAEAVEKGIRLDACKEYIRAWPGGTGSYKLGANYGKPRSSWSEVKPDAHRYRRSRQEEGIRDESLAARA